MDKPVKHLKFAGNETHQILQGIKDFPTVCEHSRCPNQGECLANGVATFLAMGTICTRNCLFCYINHGKPAALDPREKEKLAQSIKKLRSSHVVITTVTRDDLPDGGASHLSLIARYLKEQFPLSFNLEMLLPDFKANKESWEKMANSPLDVISHNMEAVESIFHKIRPQGSFQTSLAMLEYFARSKKENPELHFIVKSGIMVGFGEKPEEVYNLMKLLLKKGVEAMTIGQYIPPDENHYKVLENVHQEKFEAFRDFGFKIGFKHVSSAPFVRSSYLAHKIWEPGPEVNKFHRIIKNTRHGKN